MSQKSKVVQSKKSQPKPPARNQSYWVIGAFAAVMLVIVIYLLVSSNAVPAAPAAATQPAAQSGTQAATQAGVKKWNTAPPMTIDKNKKYTATFTMAKGGKFFIQLYPDKAPITVNNFVFLARQGYYDGTTFHRVLEGFMAQGGDPTGTGSGTPGYKFDNEVSDLTFNKAGVVAMANAGKNTNGSQFFIMFGPYGLKNTDYTIFGQVISGMEVVNSITRRDPSTNPKFTGDVIQSVVITEQ